MEDQKDKGKYKGKKCFVIMPFGKKTVDGKEFDFDYVYHELIEKAVEELDVACERCDEILGTGSIHKKMFRGIFDADVSVVDITSQNPNVFYELGVRHSLHKSVTLVIGKSDNLQKIPFNINGISIMGYEIDTNEQIEANRKKIRDLIQKGLDDGECIDSIIFDSLPDLKVERKPKTIEKREEKLYRMVNIPGDQVKQIGYITGNIKNIKNVDVWVNSENTNMQMARHFDRSISATIRYEGAKKDEAGYVLEDTIADALQKATGGREVRQGNVISTTAGELEKSNKVKRIFHAASVIGQPGDGYKLINNVTQCIRNALKRADELTDVEVNSILFPLMGTGTIRMDAQEMADQLIDTAICYMEENPDSKIQKIYFLAYTEQDREICRHTLIYDKRVDTGDEVVTPIL
jgi:O-acetyl-ADP-ribose deacetylase (regulator of RNase III)